MFYPDLEENSSRGIKSGAISKYQRNVGLYPAAFALLVNFFNQVINLFCFMQTYHCNGILFCDCGEKFDAKTYRRSQSQKRYSGKRETAPDWVGERESERGGERERFGDKKTLQKNLKRL